MTSAQLQPNQRLKSAVVRAIYVLELMTMIATHRAVAVGVTAAAVGLATRKDTRAPLSVRGERAVVPVGGLATRKPIQSVHGAKDADRVVGSGTPTDIRVRQSGPGKTDDVRAVGLATPKAIRELPSGAGKRRPHAFVAEP